MLLDKLLEILQPVGYQTIIQNIKKIVKSAIEDFIQDKPMFSIEDFTIYEYDDYLMNTNITNQNVYRIFVRINQNNNIKQNVASTLITQSGEVKQIKNKVPELFMGLQKIKKALLEQLRYYFDETTIFEEQKYGIKIQGKDILKDGIIQPYYIMIIPCIEYHEKDHAGIMYYDDSKIDVQIEYHEDCLKNFIDKYQATNGLFYQYIILLKHVFNITEKERMLPYEIFETLLYNVPNECYIDLSKDTALKIIHYLSHCDLGKMTGLDGLDYVFTSKYRSMSYLYAKKVIKTIGENLKMLNF